MMADTGTRTRMTNVRNLRRHLQFPRWVAYLLVPYMLSGGAGLVQESAYAQGVSDTTTSVASVNATTLTFWYGKRQTFGLNGAPQRWVNILGNVSDPNSIASLTYTLNGGPVVTLSVGQDSRRLAGTGDFNIDIAYSALRPLPDSNFVAVTARNGFGVYTYDTVIVRYLSGTVWPRVHTTSWANSSCLTDSAQVVDGLWQVNQNGLRITKVGYDRLVAIGDSTWRDFEVKVPITIHSFDPAGYGSINGSPSIGIFLGWSGHSDDPISGWQPKTGYKPFGCGAFYRFETSGERLAIWDNISDYSGKTIPYNVPYYFKVRVEWTGPGILYSFKVWDVTVSEPATYDLTWQGPSGGPLQGSILLLAHFVDATFGKVTITPITTDHSAPVLSGLSVAKGRTSADVQWLTDELARSRIEYGPTTAYGSVLANANLETQHGFTLTGLQQNSTYHYRISAYDAWGNTAVSADQEFTTNGFSAIVTDEFNVQPLDSALWTVQNPLGDATATVEGGNLRVAIPQNVEHTVTGSGNTMPRVVQPATDSDFEVEVKFTNAMSQQVQTAGVDVIADAANYVQFEVYSNGSSVRAYAGVVVGSTASSRSDVALGPNGTSPIYMRVKRERNTWTQKYSLNGSTWTTAAEFTHALTVRNLGLVAGNYGSPVPAHTALFDYIHATLPPIPQLVTPLNGTTGLNTTVTLVWSASAGATGYDIQVATDPTFASGIIARDSLIAGTSRQITSLTAFTKYYWRVRSRNIEGKGPYCMSRWFSTFLPVPNQVTLVAPANNLRTTADSVVCIWRKNNQPGTRYWLEISDDSLFAWPDIDSSLTDTVTIRRGFELDRFYFWRVRAGNLTGWGPTSEVRRFKRSLTGVAVNTGLPAEVTLNQNYPNPFNPTTVLEYGIPSESHVLLEIFTTLGQRVAVLSDERQSAGYHRTSFAADGLSSGIYFYRLSVNGGEQVMVKRMMLVR
jgi:hypothetical protein